jgi:hypothetical protein
MKCNAVRTLNPGLSPASSVEETQCPSTQLSTYIYIYIYINTHSHNTIQMTERSHVSMCFLNLTLTKEDNNKTKKIVRDKRY